jgi:endonuclease/exonuclease/phosphatase family metal-dependent hydrolase
MMFDNPDAARIGGPELLEHDLNKYFPELLKFESSKALASSDVYRTIARDAERILNAVVSEQVSEPPVVTGGSGELSSEPLDTSGSFDIKALAWNIERGIQFDGIVDALKHHEHLKDKDLLLITELDHGMARSGNRFVAKDIANALEMNYAFAPVYIALQKGSGVEAEMEGQNALSIHGLGMFSKWPMKNLHAIALPNGKDKMWGKEKRLGHLRALVTDIEHPSGTFRAVTVHLAVHCSREHRRRQMKIILDHLETLDPLPTLIGGDWNTTTFNAQNSTRAILGYWRRVMMGVRNVAKNHFPHPDRHFERNLFSEFEKRGYEYKQFNEIGVGTLHYHIESIEKNTNLRDWVPEWCFKFIFWAARRVGGGVSVRLDWFTGKGIELADGSEPQTIGNLSTGDGTPLSDHDAITLDFRLT